MASVRHLHEQDRGDPPDSTRGDMLAGPVSRPLIILLHTLVAIVLSYQLLFATATRLSPFPDELIVAVLLGSALLLVRLPARVWQAKWLTGTLVIVDTLATSLILYLSGNASSNLYLTYFMIMLLATFAPTMTQVAGLALLLCAAHGGTLYMDWGPPGLLEEGRLLQLPVLFTLAMFYGATTESTRKLAQDNVELSRQISERKRAEEETLRAQAFITSIVENLPTMLFVKDAGTLRFVRLNKAGEELLGCAREELIGKSCYDLLPEEEADAVTAQERQVLEGKHLIDIQEETIPTRHKGIRILSTKKIPILDEQGRPQYLLGISEDVTERKGAEEALRLKTEQLQAISECMTRFLQDRDWNRASLCLLRSALEQTKSEYGFIGVAKEGETLQVLASEGLPAAWQGCQLFEKDRDAHGEKAGLTRLEMLVGEVLSGGRVVLANEPDSGDPARVPPVGAPPLRHFLGVPILHGSDVVGMIGVANRAGGYTGELQGQLEVLMQAAGVLYDSYRRQLRESELETRLLQSQKLEAVGRLAGGIAHDFNNLLSVIVGYCHVLLEQLQHEDLVWRGVHEIKKAGEHASTLTQQLLAFSRRQVLKPKVLDLNAVVSDLEPMLLRLIGEDIQLTTKLDPGLGTVEADQGQLQQVLMNLVINARDAMPEGGALTIETANVEFPASRARSQIALSGRFTQLTVTDTGTGMDAETQSRVFEPFFTTKAQGKGTGLGLATTYGIIKQSGGYIFVDSRPGRGSTFTIYLPRLDKPAQREESIQTQHTSGVGTETVLLVEDQPSLRALLRYALERHGYTVLEAEHGQHALSVSREYDGPIHLLLTDLVMPKLNGPEVAGRMELERPGTRVLYMTGYADESGPRQKLTGNPHHLLQKPFTPQELVLTVRQILDGDDAGALLTAQRSANGSAWRRV